MALKALNSVAGFSVGEVANIVIYANSDVSPANLVVSGKSNLNSISNVIITGGSTGYLLSTDGAGNLSFIAPPSTTGITNGTSNVAIPTLNGNVTITVNGTANVGLFTQTSLDMQANVNPAQANTYQLGNATNRWNNVFANTANIAGNISAGGLLTDNLYYANGTVWDLQQAAGSNNQIQYNIGNNFAASANFTFNPSTNVLTVTGNANVSNLGTGQVLATANVTAPQLISNVATGTAPLVVTSTTKVTNLNADLLDGYDTATAATANTIVVRDTNGNITGNNISGTLSTAAQPNITSVGTLTSLNVSGNANTGNLGTTTLIATTGNITTINSGLLQNGNSNVTITANGNVTINAVGGAKITATSTGANVTGTLGVSGNANVSNLGTAQVLATANVTAPQLISNTATGTAPFVVTSTTRVANLNVATAGTADSATSATNAAAVLNNVQTTGTYYPAFISGTANGNYSIASNTAFSANIANGAITATTFAGNLVGTTVNVSSQLISTVATGTAPLQVSSTTRVSNLNVSYANVSDFNVVTTQTTGTFYPVFVNGNTTANYALGSNANISFAAATGTLNTNNVTTTNKITAGNGLQVTTGGINVLAGNVDITGNLNVTGNVNYSNVTDLIVQDPLIYIGENNTGDTYDLGIVGSYTEGVYQHTGIARNASTNYWTFFDGVVTEPTTVIDWANATYPTVYAGNFLATGNVTSSRMFANANITTPQFISNVATGTAPLQVTSTTRVANLNVAYANVSDFGVVTLQNTGIYYPVFANGSATANRALAANAGFSANLANGAVIATTFSGNLSGTNANVTTANVAGNVILGNSTVTTSLTWGSATTSSISANQTVASISTTGVTGVEFLVKGIDSTGSKYSVATVQAVTDGTNVDYSVFGTVNLGGSTGTLAVNISGGFVRLQVTPASSNSTVWTTQARII